MKQYDYLIVGAGLYGAVFAHEAKKAGKRCLVIDKRDHIAGNIYTESVEGIHVHRYGAHIFHTNNKAVWQYVNQFAEFNRYTNSPVANYHGEIYNLPFNMNTFNKMWGVVTPAEAKAKDRAAAGRGRHHRAEEPRGAGHQSGGHRHLREAHQGLHWQSSGAAPAPSCPRSSSSGCPSVLPTMTTILMPCIRASPYGGYTAMVEKMLDGVEIELGVDYLARQGGAGQAGGSDRLHWPDGRLL